MKRLFPVCASVLAGGLVLAGTSLAAAQSSVDQRLRAAAQTFKALAAPPQRNIPSNLLSEAQCVVVIPNIKRGALIFGASYGAGFMSCREGAGNHWSAPAGVSLTKGSVGLQAGGGTTDIVMLAMNQKARDALLNGRTELGTAMTAAAGPVGNYPVKTTADLLTWKVSNGAFAGITVKGSHLSQDNDANRALYGRAIPNAEIVAGKVQPPAAAQPFMTALREYSTTSANASRTR